MPQVKYGLLKKLYWLLLLAVAGCTEKDVAVSPNENKPGAQTGVGGSMARFTIAGDYLYAVDHENLKVFNISKPGNVVFENTILVGFEIETIYPFKDKLFIGSTSMVHIFSIASPAHPQKLSEAISPEVMRRCDPVIARDSVAYATLNTNGPCGGTSSVLAVYDITDDLHPRQVHTEPLSDPLGLGFSGNVLYVCDRYSGLKLYDITDSWRPQFIKSISDDVVPIDVIPYGDVLVVWTTKGMRLYDITDKQDPKPLIEII